MLFREIKQNRDAELERISRATQEHEERLRQEKVEFDKFENKRKATADIIMETLQYAIGTLTGKYHNSHTLEELTENAQNDEWLYNDKDFMNALEKIKTGKIEELTEAVSVLTKLQTKYLTMNLTHI